MSYIVLSAIVIFIAHYYQRLKVRYKISKGIKRLFYFLICFLLCLFAGLRTAYNDTTAYIQNFLETPNTLKGLFASEFSLSNVYLFTIWTFLSYHLFFKSVHIYLFLSSLVFVCPAIRLIERYSKNFSFSILFFMFGGMFLFSLAGLKQVMATGIVMMVLPKLINKEYVKYYIGCIFAIGFHAYSFLFLFIPLLGIDIFNKRTIWFCILIVVLGIGMSFFSGLISSLVEILGKDVSEEALQGGSLNVLRCLVFVVPFVLILFGNKKLKNETTPEEKVFIKISILCTMFMVLSLFGNPILFGRIPHYFYIGSVIMLPQLIDAVFDKKTHNVIVFIACLCYVAFGLYELYNDGAFVEDIFKLVSLKGCL